MKMFSSPTKVCIQGLGFVGIAMATAVASAKDSQGNKRYQVVGIELDSGHGQKRVELINKAIFPLENNDLHLKQQFEEAVTTKRLFASVDPKQYQDAEIVIVDVPLDINIKDHLTPDAVNFKPFKSAIETVGKNIKEETLVIVETTVPPGTCEKIVYPTLQAEFEKRGLDPKKVKLAHSYERVMPGKDYLHSITHYWRVFSAINPESSVLCRKFLETIVDIKNYPLTELERPIASETAKVLENSYRAMTIAFIEEWGRFAEALNFDLYSVIDAIRMRPTHSNMRQPGFGVGGYCLTKDPLFTAWAANYFFDRPDLKFPFCTEAVKTNNVMPLVTLNYLKNICDDDLKDKKILICGVSYRQDVGDTRNSPTEILVNDLLKEQAKIICHDPLVTLWPETNIHVNKSIPNVDDFDIAIFAVQHTEYKDLDLSLWAASGKIFIDANAVLSKSQRDLFINNKSKLFSIGRGWINE